MSSRRFTASLFIVAVATVASGCGSPSDKLIGKWRLDTSAIGEAVASASEAVKDSDKEAASPFGDFGNFGKAMMQGLVDSMDVTYEFQASGACSLSFNMGGMQGSKAGTWSYVRSEGEAIVVDVTIDGKSKEQSIKFIDRDTIETQFSPDVNGFSVALPQTATLRRVKP